MNDYVRNKETVSMDLLILAVILFLGAVSSASTPVSVHYGEGATFSWPLPASAQGNVVRVVNPYGKAVLHWAPDCTVTPSSVYTHRIRASCLDAFRVTFTLLGVAWQDEGPYTCRDVLSGVHIENCGQNLSLITVPPQAHIELSTSDNAAGKTEGKYLTLTCEVTKAEPPVPEHGYSWSYLPSYQGQVRRLEGKTRTLTLGPLTTQDSGQYFCQASNDPDNRWNILPVMVSVALNKSCIDALLHSKVSPKAVVEKDRDGYKAVFELAQHPRLLLVQHPNTFIITDWHAPCNFSVTPPFKDRVTNTSCDLCRRALSFSLDKLRKEDLGWYQCYDRRVNGIKIDSCSVELISKVPILVHLEPVTPDHVVKATQGSHLTLTCVVTQALPPVPEDGYSWSYRPSSQEQLRPLEGKTRTLTFYSLTRRDSGQYFCHARNDASNGRKIHPGNASVTVDVFFRASNGHEWWQITLFVLMFFLIMTVATAIVWFIYHILPQTNGKETASMVDLFKLKEVITSPSQESEVTPMAEQPREPVSGLPNLGDQEKTDVTDPKKAKGPGTRPGESTIHTTPGADNSADVDHMDTKPDDAEREPMLEESEGPLPRPGESTSDRTPVADNSSHEDHMGMTPDEAEREPMLEGDRDTA